MTKKAHVGSCLCGAIAFEISSDPLTMTYCHCSRCRKAGGHVVVMVKAKDFRWIRGKELVVRYEPPPPWTLVRCFCRDCGTYLGEPEVQPDAFPICAQLFDDDPGIRPMLHEHVSDKGVWYEITDDLPQYNDAPPLSAFKPKS